MISAPHLNLRMLAEDENFRALFEDPQSPVREQIELLQRTVNNEATNDLELTKARARLNGMRAVQEIVMRAHEAAIQAAAMPAPEKNETPTRWSFTGLPWLRTPRPTRTVPGAFPGRSAVGG